MRSMLPSVSYAGSSPTQLSETRAEPSFLRACFSPLCGAIVVRALAFWRSGHRVNSARHKFEPVQPKNPHQLTVRQHVLSAASIQRFVNPETQRVCLVDRVRKMTRPAAVDDELFITKRAYEDPFQALADGIIGGSITAISGEHKEVADRFLGLWLSRCHFRNSDDSDVTNDNLVGEWLSKDQQEILEKKGMLFHRKSGLPRRMLNGILIHKYIDACVIRASQVPWGILRSSEGQFIVPDCPYDMLPISPTIVLCAGQPSGWVAHNGVSRMNRRSRVLSFSYFFAQNLTKCPF